MPTNRISTLVIVIAAVVVAAASLSMTGSKASVPSDDFGVRHPQGLPRPIGNQAALYAGADYAQRHPELSGVTSAIDSSDFFLRHAELAVTDISDFFLRHPDWQMSASRPDTSDYFLRHPEQIVTDTTDYFLRHTELIGK